MNTSAHNYLMSVSDTDTNTEHLPTADIANRGSIHIWEGEINSLIHMAWQVHVCTPNRLYLFSFNTSTNQRSTTSLSPHLLGCLVRDFYYSPWPVTVKLLTPNDAYSGRTAPLTSKRCVLYIYSTNTGTEYFKILAPKFFLILAHSVYKM